MAIESSVIFLTCGDIAATHDFYTRIVGSRQAVPCASTIPAMATGDSVSIPMGVRL